MPILVQINVSLNWGSTGRIAEGIAQSANKLGWKCYMVHGERYRCSSQFPSYMVSTKLEERIHYVKSLLFDAHGLGSVYATMRLVKKLRDINPDVIHLHNLHGCYINYKLLFDYINAENIHVVWTLHDCWSFTGHCVYFDRVGCNRWKTQCHDCPQKNDFPKSLWIDNSTRNFNIKKDLFTATRSMTIVPVSEWLGDMVRHSFLKDKNVHVIHNGIDINVFKPTSSDIREKYNIGKKRILLGVANIFGDRKGLNDFIRLKELLDDNYQIFLIGASEQEVKQVETYGIIALTRTENVQELVCFYSEADIFLNLTYEDNYPTTNLEAMACGTPVITYKTGGSPEAVDDMTGLIVEQGNVAAVADAIKRLSVYPISSDVCRHRAEICFDKNKRFKEYVELYNKLLKSS